MSIAADNLKTGKLDGFYIPEPFACMAEIQGVAFPVQGQESLEGGLLTVLVVDSEIAKTSAKSLHEWLQNLIEACRFIENDIEKSGGKKTASIQLKYFGFPKKIVKQALTGHKGGLKFECFFPDPDTLEKTVGLASKMKILMKSVDMKSLLYPEPLRKASRSIK